MDKVLERLRQRENQALVPRSPKSGQGVVVVVVVTYGMGIVWGEYTLIEDGVDDLPGNRKPELVGTPHAC